MRHLLLPLCILLSLSVLHAAEPLRFQKINPTTQFFSEGAACADLNNDHNPDVIAGPFWYEGPDFKTKHTIYTPEPFDPHKYSENFLTFANHDFNGDGYIDIFVIPFPGKAATWFQNPGKNIDSPWTSHKALEGVDNESPVFTTDLLTNKSPTLVCMHEGQI